MTTDIFSLGDIIGDEMGDDAGDSAVWGDDAGAYYDSGDIVGDIIGAVAAARRGGLARRPAVAPAAAAAPRNFHPRTVEYNGFKAKKVRRYTLGFQATVPGSSTQAVSNQPQLPFRPERLVIPSVVGVNFALADFKVGNRSQLVADGAVPALMFSEQAVGISLLNDTAFISQTITFLAQNLTAADKIFQAGIAGTTMDHLQCSARASYCVVSAEKTTPSFRAPF